jgi:hypothetical protein
VDVDVTVTDAGHLQLSVDGVTYPPLPVEAVRALAARVPDAQAAALRQQMTAAIRALTDVLVASGPEMAAQVEVIPTGITATVDEGSFERARKMLGVEPDAAGELKRGRVVIRPQAAPAPTPEPEPTPTDPTVTA